MSALGRARATATTVALLCVVLLAGCAGRDVSPSGSASRSSAVVPVAGFQTGGPAFALRVTSLRARRFASTIRQQYDFSCGSAALATLLTYHYGMPTSEDEVFHDMVEHGDEQRIREHGFSLLDMQGYLARQGLRANGYRLPLDKLAEAQIPAIALIDNNGYRHFVVVRGVSDDRVLLADPNLGTRTIPRSRFESAWNGVLFVVLDNAGVAQASFDRSEDWAVRPRAPTGLAHEVIDRGMLAFGMPEPRFH